MWPKYAPVFRSWRMSLLAAVSRGRVEFHRHCAATTPMASTSNATIAKPVFLAVFDIRGGAGCVCAGFWFPLLMVGTYCQDHAPATAFGCCRVRGRVAYGCVGRWR